MFLSIFSFSRSNFWASMKKTSTSAATPSMAFTASFNLFKVGSSLKCAFGDEIQNNDKKLEKIGRDNVQKLKGSPLAAKTIGAVLRSNLNEKHWRNVLERERWWSPKNQNNDIMPALSLSYQHLDSHLKPCFSFCSLFPQDHEFNKEDLIYMWMAVGLVPRYGDGKKRPEDIGSEFFDELVNKSFLEKSTFRYYVMHDLLHDLATFVSKEECFRYTGHNFADIPYTVRHLSIHVSDLSEFDNFSGLGQLRTLILRFDEDHPNSLHVINGIIKKLKKLRILHLSGNYLYEFPHDVSDLLHLRYLHTCFSHKTFPSRISNLYLLQKMNFSTLGCGFHDIHEFNVGNLISLRNLRFYLNGRLKLVGVGRLTSLQDIGTNFYVGESGCKISELKDLIELTDLSISDIGYVGSIKEASEANLSNKENLQRLRLSWNDCNSEGKDTEFEEELLDQFKPHFHLNTLSIKNHRGRRPPVWMKTPSDFQLVDLRLSYCKWEYLPVLEELPFLKFLGLSNMDALKKVCHNCSGASQAGKFPSLEKLYLEDIPELEEWLLRGELSIWMPNLRNLTVEKCPKLNCLPPLPLSLERLNLFEVGLVALPEIWHDRNKSQSSSSLVELSIYHCSKLASLSGGMFEYPEYFTALRWLNIRNCKELMHLPQGGFSKFVTLYALTIDSCPLVQGHMVLPEYFCLLHLRCSQCIR
ncbi:hypothetical protein LUZ60_007600 [Juncus effusus]|nr:hypothetical protein LUZ60_007600 [Juncus effusus]